MIIVRQGLFVTIGPPGAGKSTWAKNNLPPHCLRLERDRVRECLFGSRRTYHEHPFERDVKSRVVTETMMTAMREWPEYCWAVTDTATRFDSVQPFIEAALFRQVPVTFVRFDRSDEYLWEINRTRPLTDRIPDEILSEMIALYRAEDAWWKEFQDPLLPLFQFMDGTACS